MHADRLIGIHLNLMPIPRDPAMVADPTPEEARYLEELQAFLKEETGYQWIQGTRPQTLAFALTDSPVGLAAWIVEKFRAWSDCGGDLESVFTKDQLLANIGLYWFTGAIGSSFWPYYARMHGPWHVPPGETVDVPAGFAAFPREILRPPRSHGRTCLHRPSPLDRDAQGRPFRGDGAARRAGGRDPRLLPAPARRCGLNGRQVSNLASREAGALGSAVSRGAESCVSAPCLAARLLVGAADLLLRACASGW